MYHFMRVTSSSQCPQDSPSFKTTSSKFQEALSHRQIRTVGHQSPFVQGPGNLRNEPASWAQFDIRKISEESGLLFL